MDYDPETFREKRPAEYFFRDLCFSSLNKYVRHFRLSTHALNCLSASSLRAEK